MKQSLASVLFFVATCLIAPAKEPTPSAAAPITEDNAAAWRSLFSKLAAQAPVASTFVERRHFAFRNTPIVLEGELRVSPDHGLSLHYTEPKDRIMIIDAQGILLRDHRGRSRIVPQDPRSPDVNAALLPILAFDLDRLMDLFEITASGNEASWVFVFVPQDSETKTAVGQVTVFGEETRIRKLEFEPAASQRVEIYVTASETNVEFAPEDITRFFR